MIGIGVKCKDLINCLFIELYVNLVVVGITKYSKWKKFD